MARRTTDWIPENILKAARRAGLRSPLWYVGTTNGHERRPRATTLDQLVAEVEQTHEDTQDESDEESDRRPV